MLLLDRGRVSHTKGAGRLEVDQVTMYSMQNVGIRRTE